MADKKAKNESPDAAAPEQPKRGRLGVAIITVLLLSNAGLAAVLATGSLAAGGRDNGSGAAASDDDDENSSSAHAQIGPLLELDPFVLNLDEPGRARYLRVAMSLEVEDDASIAALQRRMTVLRDRYISYLSSQQADALRTPQDKDRLRGELIVITGDLLGAATKVHAIYFTEFLIQ